MADIPRRFRDLLADETKAFMCLATIMPDGTPQVTPVWFSYDGTHVWVNSARGRVKDRNMSARPHVACLIVDPSNPYRFLQVRGEVVVITEEGADDHIRDLAAKYTGQRDFEIGDARRVVYKIRPNRVSSMG